MINSKYVKEPLDFIFTSNFFKGLNDIVYQEDVIINDLSKAYYLAFDQNVPSDYKIWQDVIENVCSSLRNNAKFREARGFVNEYVEELQTQNSKLFLEYRKKKIKKTNSKYDDFLFGEAREDAHFVLSIIAISRYLDENLPNSFLEEIFDVYKKGGWPCGMKNENIIVFNPLSINV